MRPPSSVCRMPNHPARIPVSSLPLALACTLALAAALASRSCPAQTSGLAVDLLIEDNQFLPGEEIPVGVKISNLVGRAMTFGAASNWLTFFVESRSGDIVNRIGPVPVQGEFTLESSKAGTKWWNIQPWFDLDRPGRYLVSAQLHLPDWNQHLISDPVEFTIQPASKLWEITFGVPPADGATNAEPEIRRYALQAATRGKERKLFARVSDAADSRIFKVVVLDRYLSFANPRQQLDRQSRLHVLFQTGGSTYTYCVVNCDGELVSRQRHDITTAGRPQLAKRADGSIDVVGGRRVPSYSDFPSYDPGAEKTEKDSTAAPAASTNAAPVTTTPVDPKKTTRDSKRKKREKTP